MVNLETDMLLLIFGCKVPLNITNAASGFKVLEKKLWITATHEQPKPESDFLPTCLISLSFCFLPFPFTIYKHVHSFIYNTLMHFFGCLSPSLIIKSVY